MKNKSSQWEGAMLISVREVSKKRNEDELNVPEAHPRGILHHPWWHRMPFASGGLEASASGRP